MNISNLLPSAIKRQLAAVTLVLAAIGVSPAAQANDIFEALNGMTTVESTYVSGRFAHNKKTWRNHTGTRAMDLSKGFSSLYSYQCYSEESVKKARQILADYLKKNKNVEVVMRSKQGGQEYVVYEKFKDDDMVTQMIIWSCDAPNVCEVVVIDWDKGLKRTQNPYESSVNGVIPDDDLLRLGDLSRLSALSQLSELSELSELGELGELGELSELSQLGECLGKSLGTYIGETLEIAFGNPGVITFER